MNVLLDVQLQLPVSPPIREGVTTVNNGSSDVDDMSDYRSGIKPCPPPRIVSGRSTTSVATETAGKTTRLATIVR